MLIANNGDLLCVGRGLVRHLDAHAMLITNPIDCGTFLPNDVRVVLGGHLYNGAKASQLLREGGEGGEGGREKRGERKEEKREEMEGD